MGKSIPSATRLQDFARAVSSSDKLRLPKQAKPISRIRVSTPETSRPGGSGGGGGGGGGVRTDPKKKMEVGRAKSLELERNTRLPLAQVVSDCARRWFQDTLREAKAGDGAMQVLVGQMYNSGYGVPRDPQKGRAWINKASKARSSVWRVSDKQPGYNASDSDSGEMDGDKK
ncbi:uncharacterized protein LOC104421024 [Eucalyptus grandis]|uniref:Sel1-like protein n=3 Tax=Eucalyptus grandis TaxID=71139 RepID=A0A059A9L5_EUCGR|nr:uncharacterized protein LOC104421024 [Eucalyptus grandis]XP_010031142.1 uncharacterized protein LOC104421024 [Eucalyptus grandis]KAK3407792.1 hypothetical protein EUGRSUZ_J00156 [Eucalyptus grandis]KAK3407793.1 hypothetical protein EUGRSUZ_J00156 [Eucalyptus grandis]